MWIAAEPAIYGQLAASGTDTTKTRGMAITPPPITIAAVSSSGSLPPLSSAFQLACINAASRTARATLRSIAASFAYALTGRVVRSGERNRGREPFAGEIDRVRAGFDPGWIGLAVGTRHKPECHGLSQCVAEGSRGHETHGHAIAQDEFIAPEVGVRRLDDERDDAPTHAFCLDLRQCRAPDEPTRFVEPDGEPEAGLVRID